MPILNFGRLLNYFGTDVSLHLYALSIDCLSCPRIHKELFYVDVRQMIMHELFCELAGNLDSDV